MLFRRPRRKISTVQKLKRKHDRKEQKLLRMQIAELKLEAAFYSVPVEMRREIAVLEARLRLQVSQQGGRSARKLANQYIQDSIHLPYPFTQ